MYLKKCIRCGSFFSSNENTCCNCKAKDNLDINKLKSYFESYPNITSVQNISLDTGIPINSLTRFLSESSFDEYVNEYKLKF